MKIYSNIFSHSMLHACRCIPSCSQYALEAVERYGVIRGGWLTIKRVGRCQPFSSRVVDRVQ